VHSTAQWLRLSSLVSKVSRAERSAERSADSVLEGTLNNYTVTIKGIAIMGYNEFNYLNHLTSPIYVIGPAEMKRVLFPRRGTLFLLIARRHRYS
jgi:hypothetical protein